MKATVAQVLAYRARATQLDRKLPAGSYTEATYAGLQDTIPRAGLIGLNARIEDVVPTDWDHPTLCQIWFRGGADYIIPRDEIATFTIGTLPRDAAKRTAIEQAAQRIIDFLDGRELKTREVQYGAGFGDDFMPIRHSSRSGRVLIRWNASTIFAYECERPDVDDEDARLELCRRFLHWFGPQTKDRFQWWTAVERPDATETWKKMQPELAAVEVDGEQRHMLEADLNALRAARPIEGVRLLMNDDPWLKIDRRWHVADDELHDWVFPTSKTTRGYAACALVVDGSIAGVWQRQQRKVTIHPWRRLSKNAREAIEAEALSLPIASTSKASVAWEAG